MHFHKLETGLFIQLEPPFPFLFKDETIILQWLPCQVTLMTFVHNKMKAHPLFFSKMFSSLYVFIENDGFTTASMCCIPVTLIQRCRVLHNGQIKDDYKFTYWNIYIFTGNF